MGVAERHWIVSYWKKQEKFLGMCRSELFPEAEPIVLFSLISL